jgi:DNA-binding response OmpR family regulator
MREPIDTRVLIVEDDVDYREMVVDALSTRGFKVDAVVCGEDAIDKVIGHEEKFDVVLMDVNLPGINGLETMRRLRDGCYHGHIVALTGQPRYEARALATGADRFKVKPVPMQEIIDTIMSVMRDSN